jgi:hypothetical protein
VSGLSDQAPDLWERFRAWVFGRFGLPGLIVLACASPAVFAWTQWDKVSTWPGVSAIIEWVSREPVPKTDPERLSVLVAKLNRDANDTLGNQIFEVLKEFSGIEALPLDRMLARDGRMTEAMEAEASEVARCYLQESGASVLIWGSVLDREHKIAKLFLTTSSAAPQEGAEGKQYPQEPGSTIRLPDVFWSDFAQVLRLAIASRDAEFRAKEGHYVADRLPPFIAGVHRLLNKSYDRPGWDADARGSTRVILANALSTLGYQSGQNAHLQEAVEAYRLALEEYTRPCATRLGGDPEQPRRRFGRWGSGRVAPSGWRRRWKPFTWRSRSGPATVCHSTGRQPRPRALDAGGAGE